MSKMTGSQRIAAKVWEREYVQNPKSPRWDEYIARDIDRLVSQSMAKAWDEGYAKGRDNDPNSNPYRVKKVKS